MMSLLFERIVCLEIILILLQILIKSCFSAFLLNWALRFSYLDKWRCEQFNLTDINNSTRKSLLVTPHLPDVIRLHQTFPIRPRMWPMRDFLQTIRLRWFSRALRWCKRFINTNFYCLIISRARFHLLVERKAQSAHFNRRREGKIPNGPNYRMNSSNLRWHYEHNVASTRQQISRCWRQL